MKQDIIDEIIRLEDKNGGLLRPGDLVEAARPVSSPLHPEFEWDDSEAAEKYRLEQARKLLRVRLVIIETADGPKQTRAYVSLTPERTNHGGYRPIVSVLNDSVMRNQLISDALDDLRRFKIKYAALNELAEIFSAIDNVAAEMPMTNAVQNAAQASV